MSLQTGFLIFALFELVIIYSAFLAIRHARTPQGSVAWVVFLFTAPYVAIPAFMFLGSFKFTGYTIGRRQSDTVMRGLRQQKQRFPAHIEENRGIYRALEKISGMAVGSGNDMTLLIDGKQTFDAIFKAISAAQKYVLVQSYIIHDDKVGRRLQAALVDCAARGVKTCLIYDAVGCANLSNAYLAFLTESGVEVVNAHARRGPKRRFQVNFRNHRKTVIVDGAVGFTGGLNMGDEYMGESPKFGPWRDTHVRLSGPIVLQLQLVFTEDWHWATRADISGMLNWTVGKAPADRDAIIVAPGPGDDFETGSLYFCSLINAATDRLWIASPYFVPENDILTCLKLAAMRGVDVRILTPEVADHKIPWLAALAYFDEIMEAGVEVWRYQEGFMHQKVVLVDDRICSIGTTNLDNRSCRLNFEETAIFFGRDTAGNVASMLESDFSRARRLTKMLSDRNLRQRLGAPLARLFSPLL